MAAATTALLELLKAGDHVVLTSDCYRRTRQFVTRVLAGLGVESTLVQPGDEPALRAALRPGRTKVILAESPTNPYLRVADLSLFVRAREACPGANLIIDGTFATPVNQRPIALGVDLVVHSCTKYLGGHNDLLAGAVCGRAALVQAIKDLRGVLGGVLDSLGATETLIEQPAYMSYFELTPQEREAIGITDDLVRLSVGLEDAEDVIADLRQALSA